MELSQELGEELIGLKLLVDQMESDFAHEPLGHPAATATILMHGGITGIKKVLPQIEEDEKNGTIVTVYTIGEKILRNMGITDIESFIVQYKELFEKTQEKQKA